MPSEIPPVARSLGGQAQGELALGGQTPGDQTLGGQTSGGERCPACGFDPAAFTRADTIGTLRSFTPRWRETLAGVGDATIEPAAQGETTALRCLLDHVRRSTAAAGGCFSDLGRDEGVDALLAELAGAVEARILSAPNDLTDDLHTGTHLLSAAGRALAGCVAFPGGRAVRDGVVVSVNTSSGGLPKSPIGVTRLTARSMVGDRQGTRRHHGRPWQAVSLWSMEIIAALQAEGHELGPGVAGENLTISGLDWAALRPGTRLRVGDALVGLTAWTLPCRQLTPYFVNGDFRRIDNARHPGWSRIYGAVLDDGDVRPGDQVRIVCSDAGVCGQGSHGDNRAAEDR